MHEISLNRYISPRRINPSDLTPLPSPIPLNPVIPSPLPINPVNASDGDRSDWDRLRRRQKPRAATHRRHAQPTIYERPDDHLT